MSDRDEVRAFITDPALQRRLAKWPANRNSGLAVPIPCRSTMLVVVLLDRVNLEFLEFSDVDSLPVQHRLQIDSLDLLSVFGKEVGLNLRLFEQGLKKVVFRFT